MPLIVELELIKIVGIMYTQILANFDLVLSPIMYTPILAFKLRLHLMFFLCMCYTFSSTKSYDMY